VRLAVFGLVLFVAYFAFRVTADMAFGPNMNAVGVVVPAGPVVAGEMITLGVKVHNNSKRYNDSGFAVLAFRGGEEVDGPYVSLRPNTTVVLPVRVRLRPGDHVFTLLAFEDWKKVRRRAAYHGLVVTAVDPNKPATTPTGATAPASPQSQGTTQ
jgi:hypothetical protein